MVNPSSPQCAPAKIFEIDLAQYNDKGMMHWENGLSLHSPSESAWTYDIFLYVPEDMAKPCSLYRFPEEHDATEKYLHLLNKFLPFLDIAKNENMINAAGLQNILGILNANPSWTLGHLAAFFDFHDSFEHNLVTPYLNTPDEDAGMTPLQVAVQYQNTKSVQKLMEKECSLHHKDFRENTVFHYAAKTNKRILDILLPDVSAADINTRNCFGYTPTHLACLNENNECLATLLAAGAEINTTTNRKSDINSSSLMAAYVKDHPNSLKYRDIKNGGTLLHWATSVEEINQFIDYKCDINAIDFECRTALHLMVKSKKFDFIIALLSRGADTDIRDKDGNTALHLAAQSPENLHILQCLVIFGADLNILNNKGESPRHLVAASNNLKALFCLHAVGAKRCCLGNMDCNQRCSYFGDENGDSSTGVILSPITDRVSEMLDVAGMETVTEKHSNEMPKKGRLLSLDGGGIRGLILIQMLLELESEIGKPINHCFDWITGTSTGGILALGLASGKTAKECLGLYFFLKDRMFYGSRPHSTESLEGVYREVLGDDSYLHDIKYPKLIIPCARADCTPIELHMFRNYPSPSEILKRVGPRENRLLWQVARATSAAPTYFRPFEHFIDGGLIANNPTLDALTEIQQYNQALRASNRENELCPVNIVVSLGTGLVPIKDNAQASASLPDLLKILVEIPGLLSILIDQATATDGRVVERARAWCSTVGIPYFRFNPQMSEEVGLNEKCNIKLCKTLWETKAYMCANKPKIKEVAHFLRE